jgi:hypothetical protein
VQEVVAQIQASTLGQLPAKKMPQQWNQNNSWQKMSSIV